MSDEQSWIALAARTRDVIAFLRIGARASERSAPAGGRRDEQPAGAFTSDEGKLTDGREDEK